MKEEFDPRSPYQGLIPYEEGDAHFFFGREHETQVIIANLFASSLTLLYGASGVGKSSILRAGVAHTLSQRDDLLVLVFSTWQSSPLDDLKAAVAKAASAKRVSRSTAGSAAPDPAARALLEQAETLLEYISAWSSILDCSLLIILDQFEEYFLYHPQGDAFEIEFGQAVSLADVPVSFLISIREDSVAKLDRFEKGIPAIFDNYLRLEHLDREAAQAAIIKPLARYNELHMHRGVQNVDIEPQLVEEVLDQVKTGQVLLGEAGRGGRNLSGEARIETPFLQMVMTRLWNKEMEYGSNLLRLETLKQLGNAEHIIRTHLDDAMSALNPDEQEIAANIFHYLVTPTGSKIAHSTRTLFHYTGLPQVQIQPVLNKLSGGAARILQPVAPPANPQAPPNYEIYHDVLAAAILDWRRRFMQVQDWSRHTEDMGLEQRRVMQRRIGLIALLLLIGTLIASLVGTYRARIQESKALSRELAAVALNNMSKDSELSCLLALEAVNMDPNDEAVKALRETLKEHPLLAVMKTKYVVIEASFNPDGRFILTGGGEQMARLWETTTGKLVKTFIGPKGLMSTAIFSPDGLLIATESNDRTVQTWETNSDSDKPLAEFSEPKAAKINEIAFSPDSRLVATASEDKQVRVWEARSGHSMMDALQHDSPVWEVAFSRDGTRIATACVDGNSYIWETASGRKIMTLTGHGKPIRYISFSPDGNLIATAGDDSQAHLWDVNTGQSKFDMNLNNYGYFASFSPDGQALLTLDASNRVDLWDVNTGQRKIETIYNDPNLVSYPAFSPDGHLIACSNGGNDAYVWDAATGKPYRVFSGHINQVYTAVFSPSGYQLVTTSKDGTARLWRVRKSWDTWNLGNAKNVSFSPDGRFIIGANQVWDFGAGVRIGDPLGYGYASVRFGAFSPDGEHIVIVNDYQPSAQIWDARSRTFVKELQSNAEIVSVTFSSNGKLVETRSIDHSVRVWDINTGQSVAELKDSSISNSSAISPDGQYVVTGSETANARIWDVRKQQLLKELVGHTAPVTSVAYSPDGKLIVTCSDDQRVIVWNAQTGERKTTLQEDSFTKSIAFSPDGRLIMAVSDVGTARIWPWPSSGSVSPALLENVVSATFSPDGMFILATGADGVANIYPRESFLPLPDLIEMAKARARRSLTCDERRKFLHRLFC